MYTLFHHPFCPHSRFIRLVLGEHGLDLRLVEERAWERREAFLALNPAGATPVLIGEGRPPIPGAGIIAEYLDEVHGAEADERRAPFRIGPRDCDDHGLFQRLDRLAHRDIRLSADAHRRDDVRVRHPSQREPHSGNLRAPSQPRGRLSGRLRTLRRHDRW